MDRKLVSQPRDITNRKNYVTKVPFFYSVNPLQFLGLPLFTRACLEKSDKSKVGNCTNLIFLVIPC